MPGKRLPVREQVFVGDTIEDRSRYFLPVIKALEPLLRDPACEDFADALIMAMHRGMDGGIFHIFVEESGKKKAYSIHNNRDFKKFEEKEWNSGSR
jgi:hypothetical protein